MSASLVSPYMFQSYTWPSSGNVPCRMLLSACGKQHCTRIIPWRWSSVWLKHVGWHNRCRHSNVLKSDGVLVYTLKHNAWVGFLNNEHSTRFRQSFSPSSGVQDCTYSNRYMSYRYCCLLASKQIAVSVWCIPVAVCTVLNSWWRNERPSETCRVLFQNKIILRN